MKTVNNMPLILVLQVYSGCMCEHNTEGTHCDSCTTGFNAVQWSAGTDLSANACQR